MVKFAKKSKASIILTFICFAFVSLNLFSASVGNESKNFTTFDNLIRTATAEGTSRVIVKLRVEKIKELTEASTGFCSIAPGLNTPWGGAIADIQLQDAIAYATDSLLRQLSGTEFKVNRTYKSIPYLALNASPDTLALMQHLPEVLSIQEDKAIRMIQPDPGRIGESKDGIAPIGDLEKPSLDATAGIVGATASWAMGYTGAGWYVAIVDTGIRKTHEFFSGKTVVEACYNLGEDGAGPVGDCPNGLTSMIGTGAAVHHASSYQGYDHGTHVSGIASGNNGSLYGVAKDANIIAVQVFSKFATQCSGQPCVLSWNSDSAAGLDYIYSIRGSYSISSANMSLGGGAYDAYCDGDVRKAAIDNLSAAGIATCISTGNDGYCGYIGAPGCVSSAVAVGSSTNTDLESYFNNWHATLQDLFAPGSAINSSVATSDTSYASWDGTSMAAPHVTGAWALIKQAKPTGTVSEIKTALESSGVGVTSVCDGYTIPIPRIKIDDAIALLVPAGTITVTGPTAGRTYGIGSTLPISWTSTGITGDVSLKLRKADGTEKYTVTDATAYNNSPFDYTIPSLTPGEYLVRVKKDTISDDSANFNIGGINITAPTSGQTFTIGQQMAIQWSAQGFTGNMSIILRKSDGTEKYTVTAATAYNSSPFNYTIPSLTPGTYLLRMKQDKLIKDSDTFTISASSSSITVTSPGGGTYSTGDPMTVSWSSSGITGDVRVILRKSDGSLGFTLDSATAYDNSPRVYYLPCDAPVGSYFIRIKQGTVVGESSSFTLNPSTYCISISNPLGGEEYNIGNQIPITWSTSGIAGTVKIALRNANGTIGYEIDPAALYNGSPYNYTIPAGIPTGTYFIRIKQGALVICESQNFTVN